MRILLIIDGLPGGGAEKVVLTLAQGFVTQGDQVSLFSLRDVCHYPIPETIHYQVIADHSRTPWRKLTELARRAKALDQEIIKAEQSGQFDLILSNLHKTDRIVAGSRILKKRNLWFCLHGIFSLAYLDRKTGISRWIKCKKIHRVYHKRRIVTVSSAIAADLQQQFQVEPAVITTIYNPFDLHEIRQLAQQPCEMNGKAYIIHVGRFHQMKRHDRLLEAYAKSGIDVPLVLLGQGNAQQEARLHKIAHQLGIHHNVIFNGFVPNPFPWIRHARMLVLSSDSEGFGNVLVEALILNTPVVSTCCPGGPAEILTGELAGCLAQLNSDSLAQVMRQVYLHPVKINPARLQHFDCQYIVDQYRKLASQVN